MLTHDSDDFIAKKNRDSDLNPLPVKDFISAFASLLYCWISKVAKRMPESMTAQEVIESLLAYFVQDRLGVKVVLISVLCADFSLGLIGKV